MPAKKKSGLKPRAPEVYALLGADGHGRANGDGWVRCLSWDAIGAMSFEWTFESPSAGEVRGRRTDPKTSTNVLQLVGILWANRIDMTRNHTKAALELFCNHQI